MVYEVININQKKIYEKNLGRDDPLSRKQLKKEGYREREHFWYKRNKYGSVQISKDIKSDYATLTRGDQSMRNNQTAMNQENEVTFIIETKGLEFGLRQQFEEELQCYFDDTDTNLPSIPEKLHEIRKKYNLEFIALRGVILDESRNTTLY